MQIILKLTTACNLNCAYCIEGDQKAERLPEDLFFKLVDELPELLEKIKTKDAEFLFHGGEPLLYGKDNLDHLISYAINHLSDFNVRFLMQTNGTLIDDEWIDFFKEKKISVGISMDGYPEIHDAKRRTKADEPTAGLILGNLEKMRAVGLYPGTLMVMDSAENIDADKLFDFIRNHHLKPKIHPVIPCGRAADRKDTKSVYSAYSALMKRMLERTLSEGANEIIQPLDEMVNAILGIEPIRECSYNGTCGKSFICLYPDGEVGFCGRDNLSRHLVYGNIREKSLTELYHSENAVRIRGRQEYLKTHDCKDCAEWELCHGGCAFEAMNASGCLEAKYANCQERKEFLHYLRTEGIKLMKAALVREKKTLRKALNVKRQALGEIDALAWGGSAANHEAS